MNYTETYVTGDLRVGEYKVKTKQNWETSGVLLSQMGYELIPAVDKTYAEYLVSLTVVLMDGTP